MKIENIAPMDIEKRSFEIISEELESRNIKLDKENELVTKRVIHTTADFEYVDNLYFSKDAVKLAVDAIKEGAVIVTDTNMVKSGINKKILAKFGGEAICFMADEDVAKEAKERGVTRAIVSMERAEKIEKPIIFAIGNAPTALIKIHENVKNFKIFPKLVIGVPVGFVNVIESKELFVNSDITSIIAKGRKGGSNVAAAICNALLYIASNNQRE